MSNLSIFFSFLVLLGFVPFLVWSKKEKRYPDESLVNWRDLANEIFNRDSTVPESVRVERALELGAKVLGFENAIICAHNQGKTKVLMGVGQEVKSILLQDQVFDRKDFFCGSLSDKRNSLALEWVSFTDWRNHSAHTKWGWGTYLGRAREGIENETLTLGFFQSKPRDRELNKNDKEFMENLSRWVLTMAERAKSESESINRGKMEENQFFQGNI